LPPDITAGLSGGICKSEERHAIHPLIPTHHNCDLLLRQSLQRADLGIYLPGGSIERPKYQDGKRLTKALIASFIITIWW